MNSKSSKLGILFALLTLTTTMAAASPAEMYIFPGESDVRIDSFTEYEVELENTGTTEDVYSISSSSSEVTVEPSRAPTEGTLAPGESTTLNVWYNPDTDREAGEHSFTIEAKSRASGETYTVQGIANVIRGHDVAITGSASKVACLGEKAQYQFTVENRGMQPEEFQLTTERGEISQSRVNLQEGESRTVIVTTSSKSEVDTNFNVIAASTTSYAQSIKTVNFQAETCYNSEVSVTPQNRETAAYTEAEYDVTVRNLGTKADTFTLSASNGDFSSNQIEVGAESTETTTLRYTPTELGSQSIKITAEGLSTSSQTVQLEAYNGMEVDTSFSQSSYTVCENEETTAEAQVTNTGEATDTFTLSTNKGALQTEEVELAPEETETVEIDFSGNNYEEGSSTTVNLEAVSQTFEETSSTSETSLNVENCWDLKMNVVPTVLSAGENRSAVFEVKLENTGTKENTYALDHEGPDWVSVRPEEVTVAAGKTGTAYIYAGIPYEKKGQVQITAEAVGTNVTESEDVTLVVGKEVEDAIRNGENKVTGSFTQNLSDTVKKLGNSSSLVKLLGAILAGLLLTGIILYRETR
ncbi:MAG: putative membrane protein [Candidatus Nanohaloarchaea archaeon]|jgi:uncharacterized membrane protein